MPKKLTDIQRVILATAAARNNGNVLPIPESLDLKPGTRSIVLMGMLARGLLTERRAAEGEPVWRPSDDAERTTLVIAPPGLDALAIPDHPAAETDPATTPDTAAPAPDVAQAEPKAASRRGVGKGRQSGKRAGQRGATKQNVIIGLLRRQQGATIAEMMAATRWQPHSVRGFMSGALKVKLGLAVVSEKDASGERRYYIAALKQ